MPAYHEIYVKAKVKEFNGAVNANFWGDKVPKQGGHHICIACISIDFVMKMEKNNYPYSYLEKCKYKIKKIRMLEFLYVALESDLSLETDVSLEADFYLHSVGFESAL